MPDRVQCADHHRAVGRRAAPRPPRPVRPGPVEQPHGILAVITSDAAELIQDSLLLAAWGHPVPRKDDLEILPPHWGAHDATLLWPHRPEKLHRKWRDDFRLVTF